MISLDAPINQIVIQKRIIAIIDIHVFIIIPLPTMLPELSGALDISRTKIGLIHWLSTEPRKKKKVAKNANLPKPLCPKYLAKEIDIAKLHIVSRISPMIRVVLFLATFLIIVILDTISHHFF